MRIFLEVIKLLPALLSLILDYFKQKPPVCPVPSPTPEPEPEPIPSPVPEPADNPSVIYLELNRAKSLAAGELHHMLQENAWAGWRDPEYVAQFCPNTPPLPSAAKLAAFAQVGSKLDQEGASLKYRLPQEHKKYPGRSVVRKLVYSEFKTRLEDHLEVARSYRDLVAKEPGAGKEYDSIKGWCEYIRKQE